MSKFFQAFRKRGFEQTLQLLAEQENACMVETEFYKCIKEHNLHLNVYYRVKADLIKLNLISYKLNGNYDKEIMITDKGRQLLHKIQDIEDLLNETTN